MNAANLIGRRYGMLLVMGRAENTRHGKARFYCLCDCGKSTTVTGVDLTLGHTKSCKCYRVTSAREAFTTHGMAKTPEHRIWNHIKTRCTNPRSKYFHRYGGRGISMSPEWSASFLVFYRDMGPRPSPRHSIDRKNNDGNYEHGNCRWATPDIQGANKSTVRKIEHGGIMDTIAGWSRRTGIPYLKLRRRLVDGWAVSRALEAKDAAVRATLAK
jgi:hypothetical protein